MPKTRIVFFENKYLDDKKIKNFINKFNTELFDYKIVVANKNRNIEDDNHVVNLYSRCVDDTKQKLDKYICENLPHYIISFDSDSSYLTHSISKKYKVKNIPGEYDIKSKNDRALNQFNNRNILRYYKKIVLDTRGVIASDEKVKIDLIKQYHIPKSCIITLNDNILKIIKTKYNDDDVWKKIDFEYSSFPNVMDLIEHGGKIGHGCQIFPSVTFGSEQYMIKIGNNVRITDGVKFLNHDGGMWTLRKLHKDMELADKFGTISIGDNTHIGWNTIIMPNVKIGKNCVIGCGAVVTKDIPDNSIAVGVPARVIENVDEYYKKNKDKVELTNDLEWAEKKKTIEEKYKVE